jgi:hypothetical protein
MGHARCYDASDGPPRVTAAFNIKLSLPDGTATAALDRNYTALIAKARDRATTNASILQHTFAEAHLRLSGARQFSRFLQSWRTRRVVVRAEIHDPRRASTRLHEATGGRARAPWTGFGFRASHVIERMPVRFCNFGKRETKRRLVTLLSTLPLGVRGCSHAE